MSKFFVYFNLHKHLFSLKNKKMNCVVDHAETVILANCKFKVSQAGRNRVLKEKRKNVHAGVEGYLCTTELCGFDLNDFTEITYNPYKYDSFVTVGSKRRLNGANFVILHKKKVYGIGLDYKDLT
jgi:hypothetical protein